MANANLDLPPINDPIAQTTQASSSISTSLTSTWYLWFSSFFDVLVTSLFSWSLINVPTVEMDNNTGYLINTTNTVLTLPVNANVGDEVGVIAVAPATWTINQNNGQQIQVLGSTTTLSTGSISSNGVGVGISLVCAIQSKLWVTSNVHGAITIV